MKPDTNSDSNPNSDVFQKAMPDREFLTIEEVAEVLRCSIRVVYNWTRRSDPKRRPPKLQVGKEVRFPRADLVRWLAKETKASH